MGACTFYETARGRSPEEAFQEAGDRHRHEYGHTSYSGGIGMKRGFVVIPDGREALLSKVEAAVARARRDNPHMVEHLERTLAALRADAAPAPEVLADALLDTDDVRVRDPWGPAGCIILRKADTVRPLSTAQALKLAREKWGEGVELETRRYKGGGEAAAWRPQTSPGAFAYGHPARECVARVHGASVPLARGALFAEAGTFLFFGWAKQ